MGIHGLTGFIDNNQHLLHRHELHDCSVVLDGNNLYYYLYYACHVQCTFGGDYDVFRRKIITTFESFKRCGVVPYVVMDGAYTVDGRKLKTSLSRAETRIQMIYSFTRNQRGQALPVLAYETFMQTLNELGVHHATCQFEADNEIAVLANKLRCPVISNDSDFYIFNLRHGFLPLDYIDFRPLERSELGSGSIFQFLHCHKYHVDEFISSFDGLSPSLLPLFASLLGNDFINVSAFSTFYARVKVPKLVSKKFSLPPRLSKVISVLHWLHSQSDSSDVADITQELLAYINPRKQKDVEKLLLSSVSGYTDVENFQGFDLLSFFTKDLQQRTFTPGEEFRDFYHQHFPNWFLQAVCQGEITLSILNSCILHRVILLTQVEDLSQAPSFNCSLILRKVLYGILLQGGCPLEVTKDVAQQEASTKLFLSVNQLQDSSLTEVKSELSGTDASSGLSGTVVTSEFSGTEITNELSGAEVRNEFCGTEARSKFCGTDNIMLQGTERLDLNSLNSEYSNEVEMTQGVELKVQEDSIGSCSEGEDSESEDFQQNVMVQQSEDKEELRRNKDFCVEEYTRVNRRLLKSLVEPQYHVGSVPVPRLSDLSSVSVDMKRLILSSCLGVEQDFLNCFSEDLQLFAACMVFWCRQASPRVSLFHLEAIIVGLILLRVLAALEQPETESNTAEQEHGDEYGTSLVSETTASFQDRASSIEDEDSIVSVQRESSRSNDCTFVSTKFLDVDQKDAEQVSEKIICMEDTEMMCKADKVNQSMSNVVNIIVDIKQAGRAELEYVHQSLSKYRTKCPNFNNNNRLSVQTIHSFAQLQACLLDAINLNKLLQQPLPQICPAVTINGTFLYNFYLELSTRPKPDLFISAMLGRSSRIMSVFQQLKKIIVQAVGLDHFASPVSKKLQRNKKSKTKKKDRSTSAEMDEVTVATEEIPGVCVNNKFSVLISEECW